LKLGTGQILNVVQDTDILTNKANLHTLLQSINETQLQPDTYVIGPDDPSECDRFFKSVLLHPNYIWVSKEPDSAQGEGIVVNPNITKMKEDFLINPSVTDPNKARCRPTFLTKEEEFLIQRYIENPLLLKKKKMEIRTYWMIASLDPFIVLYHDGTVRLTTKDYKNDDWKDPLIHITNTRQQKNNDPKFWNTVTDRKWTVPQLGEYLQDEGRLKSGSDWVDNTLRPYLKKVIALVAKAALPSLKGDGTSKKPRDAGRFELLGMDVILDDTLQPWLTEVQVGPGLSRDPGVKTQIIPKLIEEMFAIALEVDVSKRYGIHVSSKTIKNAHSWEIVDVE